MLTVGVFVMAGLGGLRRLLNGYIDTSAIVLAGAPVAVMATGSYGGEMLFRVYLFSLPCMAFFGAALIYTTEKAGRKWYTFIFTILLSCLIFIGFIFPYYGKELQYYFTEDELTGTNFLFNIASPGSLVVELNNNYPKVYRNYEYFTHVIIEDESEDVKANIIANPEEMMYRWLKNDNYTDSYLIITRGMKARARTLGQSMKEGADIIQNALLASPRFQVMFRNRDVIIFRLAPEGNTP